MTITWDSTSSTSISAEKNRLNKQSTHQGDLKNSYRPPIYGQIIDQKLLVNQLGAKVFHVRIHFDNRDSEITRGVEKSWYGLGYPVDFIMHVFGNDLIGKRCIVHFKTVDITSGVVYIVHDSDFRADMDAAETLPALSTILAPPGSSL